MYPTELVENGNFSDGSTTLSSQWSGVDSKLELTSTNAYLGTKCLKVTPNNTTAKAVLTLNAKPNTKYLLHIGTNGDAQNFKYYINDRAVEFTNAAHKHGLLSLFTTPADSNELTVTFEKDGGFNLQRVFVTEYGANTEIDFQNGKIGNHYVANGGSSHTKNTIETSGDNKYLKVQNTNNNWEMGPVFHMATVPGTKYKLSLCSRI